MSTMETGEDVTEIFAEIASNQKRHPHRLRYSSRSFCLICEVFKKMKHDGFLVFKEESGLRRSGREPRPSALRAGEEWEVRVGELLHVVLFLLITSPLTGGRVQGSEN